MAGSLKDKFIKIKKYGVFLPILFFTPLFMQNPSAKNILFLSIVIVYYFTCFMTPMYLLNYLIKKFDLNQKIVDICSFISVILMYTFSIYYFVNYYYKDMRIFDFPHIVFVVPFLALIHVSLIMILIGFGYRIYRLLKGKKDV